MSKHFPILGWALALLVAVYSSYQYRELQQLQADLLRQTHLGELKAEIFDQDMDELELAIADLRNRLSFARRDLALAREEINELQNQDGQDYAQSADSPQSDRPIARIMNSPRVREIGSRMMLNNRYGRFINSLDLNTEEREQLNELMSDVIRRQNDLRVLVATGEITLDEFQSEMAGINMEDALASFLTPGEMDEFYTYQDEEEERMQQQAETAMRTQLATQTPGLTEENRNVLAQILSQELGRFGAGGFGGPGMVIADVRSNPGGAETTSIRTQAQGFSTQPETYDNILGQLEGTMDDDQLAIVEGYLEQQQMQVEMIQEIMSMQGEVEGGQRQGFLIRQ